MNRTELSKNEIEKKLHSFNGITEIFESIDSTNSEARRRIDQGLATDGIFAADRQTAGRGRRGNSFYSPGKSGLYFSLVLHPKATLKDSTGITAAAAVAVTEALMAATKKDPKIKWVNDIFIENKKVCGILTEAVTDFEAMSLKAVIIGIGINLTTAEFPEELKGIAGSVNEAPDKNALIADIFNRISAYCGDLSRKEFMNKYREYSLVLGRSIYFFRNGVNYTATAKQITDSGELIAVTDKGEELLLNSGEISVKFSE